MARNDLDASLKEENEANQKRLASKLIPGPRERLHRPAAEARAPLVPKPANAEAPERNMAGHSGKRPTHEHGIRVLHKSRDGRAKRAAGGVAIAFRTGTCNLRKRDIKNRKDGQEILCVTGKIGKIPRKVAILVVYVPPDMKAPKFRELCNTLVLEIAAIKLSMGDPIIYVAGDFNHRDVGPSLSLAADLKLINTAPTCGHNTLDLIYSSSAESCGEVKVLPPLDTATGTPSNHRCV